MFGRALRWLERQFVYYPERTLKGTPDHVALPYEDVRLPAPDGNRIHGWWIPGPEGRAPLTLLLLHGNGGNISANLDRLLALHRRLGASVLTIDYRGFGLSEGIPGERETYEDAEAALSWLEPRVNGPLVYFGISLGGSVAAWLAGQKPPASLVMESAPTSVPDVAHIHVPWTRLIPAKKIMRTRYNTVSHVAGCACPILIIHGDQDREVPVDCATQIAAASRGPTSVYVIEGGTHDRPDLIDPDAYYSALGAFLSANAGWRGEVMAG